MLFRFSRLFLVLAFLSSCAYRSGFADRQLPGGYQVVSVPIFKNMTSETGIETIFTNAMVREIERSNIAKVMPAEKTDVSLLGEINSVRYVSSGSQTQGLPKGTALNLGYRVLVNVTLRMVRNSDKAQIWSQSFLGERSYSAPRVYMENLNSSNALYNQSSRIDTINVIAKDLMLEAFNLMTESF